MLQEGKNSMIEVQGLIKRFKQLDVLRGVNMRAVSYTHLTRTICPAARYRRPLF